MGATSATSAGMSPPHGGVDRNQQERCRLQSVPCRPLTGAWIETRIPSRRPRVEKVAPSRGRGSKPYLAAKSRQSPESPPHGGVDRNPDPAITLNAGASRPPHGGVDRNSVRLAQEFGSGGRPLTGAWIETLTCPEIGQSASSPPHGGVDRNSAVPHPLCSPLVAPSRGRGSKLGIRNIWFANTGRPLTGAWIETAPRHSRRSRQAVAPSRGRGSKPGQDRRSRHGHRSPPHGGVDRNPAVYASYWCGEVAPSRGRGSKHGGGR